jgi:hypothetical protein
MQTPVRQLMLMPPPLLLLLMLQMLPMQMLPPFNRTHRPTQPLLANDTRPNSFNSQDALLSQNSYKNPPVLLWLRLSKGRKSCGPGRQ